MENPVFDNALFDRVKQDNRLAFETLFSRYFNKLCAFANSYLQNRDDAEEIVSDVFLLIWKKRTSIKITTSVRAYLYVSVRHAVFAKVRTRRDNVIPLEDVLLESDFADTTDPIEVLNFTEIKNQVEAVIAQLPPRCRQIFVMKWSDGLSYKEIAEIVGIAEKTVENQVVKAFDILRKSIRKFQTTH